MTQMTWTRGLLQVYGRMTPYRTDTYKCAEFPKDSRVSSVEPHGVSFWGHTSKINVELADGTPISFFIKVINKEIGKDMFEGEFESMKAIYKLLPEFAPKPIAWGTYELQPNTHFFLCEYREIDDHLPDPHKFTKRLAELHQKSQSPEGKFGFHVTTYSGNLPQMVELEESWETFFAKNLRLALDLEIKAKGNDPEFGTLISAIFDRVIPRLLRPLESDGRSVKPSLVHGDLWYANSGIDVDTDESIVYDACCFYAHNECKLSTPMTTQAYRLDEFGQWRPICNRFGAEYLEAYHSYIQISPPEEDYDGRLDLYKLCVTLVYTRATNINRRFNTHVSALFPKDQGLREQ